MERRHFLRAAGVTMALPWLEALGPISEAKAAEGMRRRFVAINVGLGLHAENLFPKAAGTGYEMTPYLKVIERFRDDFTIISGTSHPGVDGGHSAEKSFLTCAPHPGSPSFRNTQSLDQVIAEKIGGETRFGYLALSLAGRSLSWSRGGVEVPSETRPSRIFEQLFLEGRADEKKRQVQRLKDGQSVMDVVLDKSRSMSHHLSHRDKEKLDEYFTAVRETEKRLVKAEEWEYRPKPVVEQDQPVDISNRNDIIGKARLMYDMMALALQTDSTRVLTFFKNGINAVPKVAGVSQDYHNLSHHGKNEEKIAELTRIETEQFRVFGEFLDKLHSIEENGVSLLDQTQVLFGSNLGNASSHNNLNLPLILAGGGYRHGKHLAFDTEKNQESPRLFVSMLQRLGLEHDRFANTTGTLPGLEFS